MDRSTFPLLRDGKPCVVLAVPGDSSGDDAARLISRAIRERFGFAPPVRPGVVPGDETSILALGCLANNPFIESLYVRFRTLVDRWYPGAGGFVIQPVALAGQNEPQIIVIGASDAAGLEAGARAFSSSLETLDPARPVLPWKLEVALGPAHLPLPEDRIDALGTSSSEIPAPHSDIPDTPYVPAYRGGSARDHLLRLGMYGPHADNDHFSRSSELGLRYLYSGDLEDARRYRSGLLEEIETGVLAKLYHYKSIRMFQLWELLGPCEVFTEDDRRRIDAALLDYLEHSGVASEPLIKAETTGRGILNRHTACEALNLWLGADYFGRAHGDRSWLEHRKIADAYFRSQAGTDVPLTGLTEGYCTYLEVYLDWMLLSCPEAIRHDRNVRLWADRLAGLCTNRGTLLEGAQTDSYRYCYSVMRRLAYLLDDPGYLFVSDLRERAVQSGNDRVAQFSAGQAWAGDALPAEPPGTPGLRVFPLNERHRLVIVPELEAARGFDRAIGRGGWSVDDEYLAVIGIIGPNKTLPNAGAVAGYDRFGARLLASPELSLCADENAPSGYSVCTVNVAGRDADCRRAAELVHRSTAGAVEILAFRARAPGLYDWYRVLIWLPGSFLLTADSVLLERPEAATAAVHWRCAGRLEATAEGCLKRASGSGGRPVTFRVDTISGGAPLRRWVDERPQKEVLALVDGATPRLSVLHTEMPVGPNPLSIVSLLHAVHGAAERAWSLEVAADAATVSGVDRTFRFSGLAPDREGRLEPSVRPAPGKRPWPVSIPPSARIAPVRASAKETRRLWTHAVEPSSWAASALSPFLAVGTAEGRCLLLDSCGRQTLGARAEGAITAVCPTDDGLIAGTVHGEVVRFDGDGRKLWSHRVPVRPERTFWWWWFAPEPMVGALAWGRDEPSGRSYVAAGTGSCSLNVLDAASGELLANELSRYGLADMIRVERSAGGSLELMVGHSRFTCSSTVRAWRPPWREDCALRYDRTRAGELRSAGWDMSGVRDFAVDELTVSVLRHGTFNQLSSYARSSGEHRFTVDVGGAPAALVAGRDGPGSVVAASRDGWLSFYDPEGRTVSSSKVAESLCGMARQAGRLLAWGPRDALVERGPAGALRSRPLPGTGAPRGWMRTASAEGLLWRDAGAISLLAF